MCSIEYTIIIIIIIIISGVNKQRNSTSLWIVHQKYIFLELLAASFCNWNNFQIMDIIEYFVS